jgi:signal transduction histidine kinase/CheY-like chemotaxis protein
MARSWKTALVLTATFAVLTALARFGCTDAEGNVGFWPANGALVAAWLILPRRYGLAVSIGSLLLNVWINSFFKYTLFQNALYASLNIEVSFVTAVLAKRFCGAAIDLSRLTRFAVFSVCAWIACASEAAIGEFYNGVTVGYTSFAHEWLQWALSDTIGLVISTPAILFAVRFRAYSKYFPISHLESAGLVVLTIATGCWAFSLGTSTAFLFTYPVLILTAFRAGPPLVLLNALVLSVIASSYTAHGEGPLVAVAGRGLVDRQEALQPYLVSLILSALPSNSALGERNRNALRLSRLHGLARDARAAAMAASRAKTDFIANISHEIRTPLNGILGMTEALIGRTTEPETLARLRIVQDSGEGLLTVLNDILDISKIEAGAVCLDPAPFDLERLVRDAFATFRALAERKGLVYVLDIAPGVEGHYLGDEGRIRQILNNLISNAMKFTETGQVTLSVGCEAGRVSFAIFDTGVGIPPEQVQGLFERFSQADTSTTRRFGGTGLGLAISAYLACLMDGAITVSSLPGSGSTFTLEVPLRRLEARDDTVPSPEPPPSEVQARSGLRILVVEDNPVNQLVLAALLDGHDFVLSMAANGHEALETFGLHAFDLVLMDMLMPVMDGTQAIQAIRELERATSRQRTPIVVLTANAMQHHLDAYARLDIDGVVAKPVNVAALYQAIGQATRENRGGGAHDDAPHLGSAAPR